ncbi:GNAT family N-acetyltransferase [Psychrobacillus sp.]|uniref:GNAT family N-acetyltransferase n=1 Tax=Psychrobacillus sp. TaxID=1871623 RepID=UPI0028BDB147|nr:GNAT family N-acetyltransferase [Psychrobacillus sp.]
MEIRLLTAEDANAYWELRLEALLQNPEAFATSYEEAIERQHPVEKVANNLRTEGNYTYGALENGQLVGMLTLLVEQPLKLKHRANIFAVYVSPSIRGLGVGNTLVTKAIEKAKSIESLVKLNLSVVSSNKQAKRLYEKLGFKVFGVEEKALKLADTYYTEEHMTLILK